MKTKLCKKCGIDKPLDEMVKNKNCSDRCEGVCKTCRKERFTEYNRRRHNENYIKKDYGQIKCKECETSFKQITITHKFCSKTCAHRYWWLRHHGTESFQADRRRYNKLYAKLQSKTLPDNYIKKLFRWGKTDRIKNIPNGLIELKRQYLKLHRIIYEKQREFNNG